MLSGEGTLSAGGPPLSAHVFAVAATASAAAVAPTVTGISGHNLSAAVGLAAAEALTLSDALHHLVVVVARAVERGALDFDSISYAVCLLAAVVWVHLSHRKGSR
jgi:hypothetical protein